MSLQEVALSQEAAGESSQVETSNSSFCECLTLLVITHAELESCVSVLMQNCMAFLCFLHPCKSLSSKSSFQKLQIRYIKYRYLGADSSHFSTDGHYMSHRLLSPLHPEAVNVGIAGGFCSEEHFKACCLRGVCILHACYLAGLWEEGRGRISNLQISLGFLVAATQQVSSSLFPSSSSAQFQSRPHNSNFTHY